jgi:hypothetical protein
MMVLRKMKYLSITKRDEAVAWLLIGAIFFAMRSCEYLHTSGEESKRTKIIRLKNITFKKGSSILHHSDQRLYESDLVRIQFEYQKNDKRDVRIHMFRSGDETLCPVIAWANTVKRVRAIPESSDNSPVCLFSDDKGNISNITAAYVRSRLRATVTLIGEDKLGFTKDDIGLHSIRSGGAMAMFLSGTSVIIIQRVGRWSSEAFLEYIREQVESFTLEVSSNMLKFENFLNLNQSHRDKSTHKVIEDPDDDNEEQNEDGPDSVPFGINFNELSINSNNGNEFRKSENGGGNLSFCEEVWLESL